MSEREKNSVCHKCGKYGHQKRNCASKGTSKTSKTSKTSITSKTSKTPITPVTVKSSIINLKKINNFLVKCADRPFGIEFKHKNKLTSVYGKFKDGMFRIKAVDNTSWSKYCRDEFPEVLGLSNAYFTNLLKVMEQNPIFTKITCNMYKITWSDILEELRKANKLKYTYVAEDKRSGCNLLQILEIDGEIINHNPHQYYVGLSKKGPIYERICQLYDSHKAPTYAQESIICLLAIRQFKNKKMIKVWKYDIPKDLIKMICKILWQTRYEKCWLKNNVDKLLTHRKSINITYSEQN